MKTSKPPRPSERRLAHVTSAQADAMRRVIASLLRNQVGACTNSCPTSRIIGTNRTALLFLEPLAHPGTCRVCGCTEARFSPGGECPGGCSWADELRTLCSTCAEALLT